jgi:hypothetical protein
MRARAGLFAEYPPVPPPRFLGRYVLAAVCACLCLLYTQGIQMQEAICSIGASDQDAPELGLIIVGLGQLGQKLLQELMEETMFGDQHVIEPVPGGPRFRILCIADSSAALCPVRSYIEPPMVDIAGFSGRQLAAILHHKQDERLPLR